MMHTLFFKSFLLIAAFSNICNAFPFQNKIVEKNSISNVRIFKTPYHFNDFVVPIDSGKQAPINWKSNPSARRFRTVIKEGVKRGVNFAGHYCIVQWGCGTLCQSWVIVDLDNGKIYDGISTCRGLDYRSDSRLIILDPPDGKNGEYSDNFCMSPTVYQWKHNKLDKLK
jgi:hypothetical protein